MLSENIQNKIPGDGRATAIGQIDGLAGSAMGSTYG